MQSETQSGTGSKSRRGGWSAAMWVLFALLVVHFVLAYTAPRYLRLPSDGIGSWFASPTGRAASRRGGIDMPGMFGQRSRLIHKDDRTLLWAGADESDHFDITASHLFPNQLQYGLGRERFPALIDPQFESAKVADEWLDGRARVLAVKVADEVKVYPVTLLTRHEVVNDVVGGMPVFAAYCILADLGAVYDRQVDGHVLTFALSGYTYQERGVWDGRRAFVLWDRETESLWWPPIGKAVTGQLIDRPLNIMDQQYWSQSTWSDIRDKYPQAVVLIRDQDFERPKQWPRITVAGTQSAAAHGAGGELGNDLQDTAADTAAAAPPGKKTQPAKSGKIAPRWGKNAEL